MLQHFEPTTRRPAAYVPLGNADSVERAEAGVRLRTGDATVEVTALAPGVFRVGMFAGGRPVEYGGSGERAPTGRGSSGAGSGDGGSGQQGTGSEGAGNEGAGSESANVTEEGGVWRIRTAAGTAVVATAPVRIGFEDGAGQAFAVDDAELRMGMLPLPEGRGHVPDPLGPPGRVHKRRPVTERYFGCGQRTGGLEKTGSYQIFWNVDPPAGHTASLNNLYTSIPFLLALDGGRAWGLFLDAPGRSEFDLGHGDPERLTLGTDGGDLVYYVFAGPAPADVVRRFTALTGRTPMPPLWALGNHQSSWNYESAGQVRAVAAGFRAHDIPCDALYLDIDYMDGYRVFTWDRERFPDPAGFVAGLGGQGFRVVTITDPGVKVDTGYHVYTSGQEGGHFCLTAMGEEYRNAVWPGVCAFPDFTSSRARAWWGAQLPALLDAGVAGVWCDMNEPALFIPGQSTMPPTVVHPGDEQPRIHAQVHNLYGLLMARATREGLERLRPDQRPFVISRSGYAGLQRYALQWTGDNSSWWEHLWMAVPQLQNMGLSGIAWCGVDVGGFWGDTDGELLTRWTEFGIFQPFCRNHSAKGTRPQEPWAFGEPYTSHIRRMLKLRMRLLPYLYTLFEECHRTGAPILRPLLWAYPDDEAAYAADATFMLGEALLVAPVTRPGVGHRSVYLPAGTWFHWWSGARVDGPAHLLEQAPLGEPPVYVRANTPLPLWPEMEHTGARPPDPLTVVVYPAEGEGEGRLYEDAGEGYGYRAGEFARTRMQCRMDGAEITLRFDQRRGHYQPPRTRIEVELRALAAAPTRVQVDGAPFNRWQFAAGMLRLDLPDSGGVRQIVVTLGGTPALEDSPPPW